MSGDRPVPPDVDCYTLPNGDCIANPCRLHRPEKGRTRVCRCANRRCDHDPLTEDYGDDWEVTAPPENTEPEVTL